VRFAEGNDDLVEKYFDDLFHRIELVRFPDEYYKANEYFYVLQNKLDKTYLFCSDLIYQANGGLKTLMKIVEQLPMSLGYRPAYREYKKKYIL
jgi:hypothetical protein